MLLCIHAVGKLGRNHYLNLMSFFFVLIFTTTTVFLINFRRRTRRGPKPKWVNPCGINPQLFKTHALQVHRTQHTSCIVLQVNNIQVVFYCRYTTYKLYCTAGTQLQVVLYCRYTKYKLYCTAGI